MPSSQSLNIWCCLTKQYSSVFKCCMHHYYYDCAAFLLEYFKLMLKISESTQKIQDWRFFLRLEGSFFWPSWSFVWKNMFTPFAPSVKWSEWVRDPNHNVLSICALTKCASRHSFRFDVIWRGLQAPFGSHIEETTFGSASMKSDSASCHLWYSILQKICIPVMFMSNYL